MDLSALADLECTTSRPKRTVDVLVMSRGVCNMWKMSFPANDNLGFPAFPSADAAGVAALDFLERSRDVANELVVDYARAETSTSEREKNTRSRSGSAV